MSLLLFKRKCNNKNTNAPEYPKAPVYLYQTQKLNYSVNFHQIPMYKLILYIYSDPIKKDLVILSYEHVYNLQHSVQKKYKCKANTKLRNLYVYK